MTSRCPRLPLSALLFAPAFAAACSSPSEPTPDHEPRSVVTHVPITADTHVDFNVVPNQVHGHWDYLLLHPWGKTKVLVRADEADLAAAVGDDVLTSAALELTVKYAWNGWAPDATVSAHAVLQPWEEMGATFNCRNDSNPFNGTEDCAPADAWDMVTGSTDAFDPTPLSTAPIQGDAGGYTVALDITGGVQSILDGTSENLGWAVRKSDEHAAGQLYFYSRNGWLVENPPRIVITTETPTGTSTGGASTSAGAGDTQGTVGGQEGSGGVTSNTTGGSAGTTGEPPGPSGTVQGHLVDALTMEPLVGAAIVIGEQQGFTDNLGTFVLSEVDIGAQLNITGALPGYSTAHKRIDVADGETTVVELCATAAVEDPIADVEMGGTVQTVEDVVVDLPPAAFVDSEGNPVVGEVELTTALLNDTDTIQAAPGGMIADIGAGTEAQLESFGMAEFVFTQDGEELELADGVQVDIELPLSEGHGFAEGEEVALWSFDEDSGVWIQEGTGVVSGDMFLATVDHFSWWNVDQPIENNGCINGRLVDDLGDPIVGANVTLNGLTYIGTMDAVTGPDGGFCVQGLNGGTAELRAFSIDPTFGVQVEWTSGPLVLPDGFACGDAGCIDIGDQTPDFTVYGCAAADVPPYIDLNPTQDVPDPLVDWELRSGGAPIDGGTILGETLFDDRNFCLSYALGDADEIAVDGPCGEVVFPLDGTPGSCGGPDCQVLDADAIFGCEEPAGTTGAGGDTGGGDTANTGSNSDGGVTDGGVTGGGLTGGAGNTGDGSGGGDTGPALDVGGGGPSVCSPPDADGDGVSVCAGDCNDADASAYPGAVELCDDGIDTNCNGFGDVNPPEGGCVTDVTGETCDDFIDLGVPAGTYAVDLTGASEDVFPNCWGGPDRVYRFAVPEGDTRQFFFSNAFDDGVAFTLARGEDCVPEEVELIDCFDGEFETFLDPGQYFLVVSEFDMGGVPGAATFSISSVDPQTGDCLPPDNDADGFSICEGDCDDDDAALNPSATDVCGDGLDNDCNGSIDQQSAPCDTGLPGVCAEGLLSCNGADEECTQVNPSLSEICDDGLDNDCDGSVDEDGTVEPTNACTMVDAGLGCGVAIDLSTQNGYASGTFSGTFDAVDNVCVGDDASDVVLRFDVPAATGGGTGGGTGGPDVGGFEPLGQAEVYVYLSTGGMGDPGMGETGWALMDACPGDVLGCQFESAVGDQFNLEGGEYFAVGSRPDWADLSAPWAVQIGIRDPDTGVCIPDDADGDGLTACDGDCVDVDPTVGGHLVEQCGDGIDNDCNGVADDLFGDCATGLPGVCDDGFLQCSGASALCSPRVGVGSLAEVCGDGLDNDCDGAVDEVDCTVVAAGESCDFPIELAQGGSASGDFVGATRDEQEFCFPIDTGDRVVRFTVPDLGGGGGTGGTGDTGGGEESLVRVRITPGGGQEVGYQLLDDCDEPQIVAECFDVGMGGPLEYDLPPGDYFVVIGGFMTSDPNTPWSLSVEMVDPETGECLTGDDDADGFNPCEGDCDETDAGSNPGGTEVCDGADNDCNGVVDDFDGGPCSTGLPGICDAGTLGCEAAAVACLATTAPEPELCGDGIDNDCDGEGEGVEDPDCLGGGGGDTCGDALDLGSGGFITVPLLDATFSGDPPCTDPGPDRWLTVAVPDVPGDWRLQAFVSHDHEGEVGIEVLDGCGGGSLECQYVLGDAGGMPFDVGVDQGQSYVVRVMAPDYLSIDSVDVALALFDQSTATCAVPDGDADGLTVCNGDCDDTDPAVFPGATEVCGNGIDDNCNGQVDIIGGACSTGLPGQCADGVQQCNGAVAECVSVRGPEAETCGDLNDSDCDGGDDTVGCTTVGPAEHCGNAAPVPADGRIAGTFATTTNEIEGNCTSDDPEVVYTFDIPDDGTSYEARVRYFGQSNNAVLVRPPESCGDQYGSQAICDFFDENWQFMTPGTHVLIIEGNALDSYDVRVELRNDVQQCLIPATDDADADGVGACADEPDCDDADATVFPGAPEACTGIDNDCNNLVDDIDVACDTGLPGICGEGREICVGSGSTLCEQTQLQQTELCDNLDDDDCDGFTDAADPEGCEVVPPGACDAPLSLPLDDTTAIDLSSGLPLEDCQCACGPELPSLVFAFTLDAASPNWEVQFDAPGAPPGTEFELVEGTTCDSANGIACFSGNDNLGLPPGDYVLIVTSVDPMALSPFDLTVTATPI